MFQNITGEFENKEEIKRDFKPIILELLKFQNIIIYILTLLMSTISIKQDIMPFGVAMLAATLGSSIPVVRSIYCRNNWYFNRKGHKCFF